MTTYKYGITGQKNINQVCFTILLKKNHINLVECVSIKEVF